MVILNQQVAAAPPMDDPVQGLFTGVEIQDRAANQPTHDGLLTIQRRRAVTIHFDSLQNIADKMQIATNNHVLRLYHWA